MKLVLNLLAIFSTAVLAAPIDLGQAKGKVEFLAVGQPAALKIRGKLPDEKPIQGTLELKDGKLGGVAKVKLDGFDTGINLRNQHMKEKYLETQKYPETTLTLDPIAVPANAKYTGPFSGKLNLHGVEKEVTGTSEITKEGDKLAGNFNFEFELSDFKIDVPKYLGITVSKKVKIEVAFQQ